MVDKTKIAEDLIGKWSIKPSLAEKLADIVAWMADKDMSTTNPQQSAISVNLLNSAISTHLAVIFWVISVSFIDTT